MFFAENCVGVQFGIRKEGSRCAYLAFDSNTFDAFVIAETADEFMHLLTTDMEAVSLGGNLIRLIEALGEVRKGHNFAPYISPLLGGSAEPDNWSLAPVRARMITAVEEFKALQGN